jgi:cell division cycle 20-like protein 1 (cofactor of APC complex)
MGPDDGYSSLMSNAHISRAAESLNTPLVATPPRSTTPPHVGEKRKSDKKTLEGNGSRQDRSSAVMGAEAIDPSALNKALRDFEDAGRHRDVTPGGSPSRKRQRVYGDRYGNPL